MPCTRNLRHAPPPKKPGNSRENYPSLTKNRSLLTCFLCYFIKTLRAIRKWFFFRKVKDLNNCCHQVDGYKNNYKKQH